MRQKDHRSIEKVTLTTGPAGARPPDSSRCQRTPAQRASRMATHSSAGTLAGPSGALLSTSISLAWVARGDLHHTTPCRRHFEFTKADLAHYQATSGSISNSNFGS